MLQDVGLGFFKRDSRMLRES